MKSPDIAAGQPEAPADSSAGGLATTSPWGADAREEAEARAAPQRRARMLTALDGALALMAVLLVTQMWLLTATLEAVLAGHHGVELPGLLVSAVLFAGCAALLAFIRRLDRRM